MNVDDNLLRGNEEFSEMLKKELERKPEKTEEEIKQEFLKVPPELQNAAQAVLRDKTAAFVSKKSGGKLSKWAAQQRNSLKNIRKQQGR